MKLETQYIIVGPDIPEGDMFYWNVDKGWGNYDNATTFDREIFTVPLPPGAEGIYEITTDKAELVAYYTIMPSPIQTHICKLK